MSFNKQVAAFLKSHKGHTQKALAITVAGIEHMLEHKDWDGLANLINKTEGRMGKRIRDITAACVGGITLKADRKHHTGMRFKLGDNFGPTELLDVFKDMVQDGETIFSDRVSKLLGQDDKAEAVQKTPEQVREHLVKFAAKHGLEVSKLEFSPMSAIEAVTPEIDH